MSFHHVLAWETRERGELLLGLPRPRRNVLLALIQHVVRHPLEVAFAFRAWVSSLMIVVTPITLQDGGGQHPDGARPAHQGKVTGFTPLRATAWCATDNGSISAASSRGIYRRWGAPTAGPPRSLRSGLRRQTAR